MQYTFKPLFLSNSSALFNPLLWFIIISLSSALFILEFLPFHHSFITLKALGHLQQLGVTSRPWSCCSRILKFAHFCSIFFYSLCPAQPLSPHETSAPRSLSCPQPTCTTEPSASTALVWLHRKHQDESDEKRERVVSGWDWMILLKSINGSSFFTQPVTHDCTHFR